MKKHAIISLFLLSVLLQFNTAFAIVEPSNAQKKPTQAEDISKKYAKVTEDEQIIKALECLKGSVGEFSLNAILGNNLTNKPVKILFQDLATINPEYATFDALGWKKRDKLYIYINPKHQNAPVEALAALLSHEALHQDEYNSINEETYAWTFESAVWTSFVDDKPELEKISHPLVNRENLIKQLFARGNYSDKYIRKSIISNPGYQNLPSRSPGFEDNL